MHYAHRLLVSALIMGFALLAAPVIAAPTALNTGPPAADKAALSMHIEGNTATPGFNDMDVKDAGQATMAPVTVVGDTIGTRSASATESVYPQHNPTAASSASHDRNKAAADNFTPKIDAANKAALTTRADNALMNWRHCPLLTQSEASNGATANPMLTQNGKTELEMKWGHRPLLTFNDVLGLQGHDDGTTATPTTKRLLGGSLSVVL
jgi:hypothetical protein